MRPEISFGHVRSYICTIGRVTSIRSLSLMSWGLVEAPVGFRELLRVDSGSLGLTEGRRELWRVVECFWRLWVAWKVADENLLD